MHDQESASVHHLEHARELVWEALERVEEAQRILFKAGDCYVARVWGDGVRAIIDVTERLTNTSGELTAIHIEIRHMVRRDGEQERSDSEQ